MNMYLNYFSTEVNEETDNKPIRIILCDEKICGSIHLAIVQSYKNVYNINDSSIHWDLVKLLTPKYGGGKLYFDDQLIIDNGEIIKRR